MSRDADGPTGSPSPEQLRYALLLDWGMKLALAALVAGFAAYVSGLLPALIPLEALPRLWTLPVADYVRESGMATGWGWLALPGKGDVVMTAGIAMLAGISIVVSRRAGPRLRTRPGPAVPDRYPGPDRTSHAGRIGGARRALKRARAVAAPR